MLEDGRLLGEADQQLAPTLTLQPTSRPQPFGGARASAEDGTFTIVEALSGQYWLQYGRLPAPYYVAEVRLDSRPIPGRVGIVEIYPDARSRLDITLASDGASVSGVVTDDDAMPVVRHGGLLVEDPFPEYGYFRPFLTDENGQFVVYGLPPGRYRVLVWEGWSSQGLQVLPDPFLIDQLWPQSTGVRVNPDARVVIPVSYIEED